jgi:hypothetical protein
MSSLADLGIFTHIVWVNYSTNANLCKFEPAT